MDDAILQDAQLYQSAFAEIRARLLGVISKLDKPRTAKDLIEISADLSVLAERFDSLTRGVLDLQGRMYL